MRITTSDECYRHFIEIRGTDGDGDPDLVGLFAYALVERERLDWIDHCVAELMPTPTNDDIQRWFQQKPASYFQDKLRQATARFDGYARGYLKDEIEAAKRQAIETALAGLRGDLATSKIDLITRIDGSVDRSAHWGRSITQGFFGNLAFAIILVTIIIIAAKDPSAVAVVKDWLR